MVKQVLGFVPPGRIMRIVVLGKSRQSAHQRQQYGNKNGWFPASARRNEREWSSCWADIMRLNGQSCKAGKMLVLVEFKMIHRTRHPELRKASARSASARVGVRDLVLENRKLTTTRQTACSIRFLFLLPAQDALIDGFAPAEALFHTMPERDLLFAVLPAQQDDFVFYHAGKIQQADVQVFHLRSEEHTSELQSHSFISYA